jgi:hypothetical protein
MVRLGVSKEYFLLSRHDNVNTENHAMLQPNHTGSDPKKTSIITLTFFTIIYATLA